MRFENEVAQLEEQQTQLTEQIRFAKTMRERERLLQLRAELKADHERLKELRLRSDEIAAKNKPKIAELEEQVKALRLESFDAWMNAEELERANGVKSREIQALDRQIQSV